jgi:hypothetical protein
MDCLLIKKDILAALTYFGLFSYPLNKEEIFNYLTYCSDRTEFEQELNSLIGDCLIFKCGIFYSISDNPMLAYRRTQGNAKAAVLMKKAERAASLISFFPFVRGVAISGSLSKKFADEETDVDFFIITSADRLWVARSCLHLLKKISFLFNKQNLFCMNYFIDESNLIIKEKNIFTAVEVATLIPLQGKSIFDCFFRENNWVSNYFPNSYFDFSIVNEKKIHPVKYFVEWLFGGEAGDKLDDCLMNLTAKRWNAKTTRAKKNKKGWVLSMWTDKHFSKPNPENFQKYLLRRFNKSLNENYKLFELSRYF